MMVGWFGMRWTDASIIYVFFLLPPAQRTMNERERRSPGNLRCGEVLTTRFCNTGLRGVVVLDGTRGGINAKSWGPIMTLEFRLNCQWGHDPWGKSCFSHGTSPCCLGAS